MEQQLIQQSCDSVHVTVGGFLASWMLTCVLHKQKIDPDTDPDFTHDYTRFIHDDSFKVEF